VDKAMDTLIEGVCCPRFDTARALEHNVETFTKHFHKEGEFDIKGLIKCLDQMGYSGPWAIELFSQELVGLSLQELNTRAFETTMAQFRD
jgi:L-ribulose-5-phosphate 3-epimerase UlaE